MQTESSEKMELEPVEELAGFLRLDVSGLAVVGSAPVSLLFQKKICRRLVSVLLALSPVILMAQPESDQPERPAKHVATMREAGDAVAKRLLAGFETRQMNDYMGQL